MRFENTIIYELENLTKLITSLNDKVQKQEKEINKQKNKICKQQKEINIIKKEIKDVKKIILKKNSSCSVGDFPFEKIIETDKHVNLTLDNIEEYYIKEKDEWIVNFNRVEILYCNNLSLKSLPNLPNCRELYCSRNRIIDIGFVPKCEILECHKNRIQRLHNMNNCIKLICNKNPLIELGRLPKCVDLYCDDTLLRALPDLPCCKNISLKNTQILYYPYVPKISKNRIFIDKCNKEIRHIMSQICEIPCSKCGKYRDESPGRVIEKIDGYNWILCDECKKIL